MSGKRGASDYITRDGIGSMSGQDDSPVVKATAAQLANRKIKQMRKPRGTGASSGFASSPAPGAGGFSFGNGPAANSFPPPSNGAPAIHSTSTSFGGPFGVGGEASGSGFNFNSNPNVVNNPFQNAGVSSQAATNGTNGGFSFNFGGTQDTAPSTGSFQFNSQPATTASFPSFTAGNTQTHNMFGSTTNVFGAAAGSHIASNGFGGTTSQPTPNLFGTAGSQNSNVFGSMSSQQGSNSFASTNTSVPNSSGVFGATSAAPAASESSNGFAGFGATASPVTNGFGGGGFGSSFGQAKPELEKSPAPTSTSIFGQQNPVPDWNKVTENGTSDQNGAKEAESPDRPPHVEQEGDTPKANPFANLARPPQPQFKPNGSTEKPTTTSSPFSFGQSTTTGKKADSESGKTTAPQSLSLFGTPIQRTEQKDAGSGLFTSFGNTAESQKEKVPEKPSLFSSSRTTSAEPTKEAPSFFSPMTPTRSELPDKPSNPFASLQRAQPAENTSVFGTPAVSPANPQATPAFNFQLQSQTPKTADKSSIPSPFNLSSQKTAEATPVTPGRGLFQPQEAASSAPTLATPQLGLFSSQNTTKSSEPSTTPFGNAFGTTQSPAPGSVANLFSPQKQAPSASTTSISTPFAAFGSPNNAQQNSNSPDRQRSLDQSHAQLPEVGRETVVSGDLIRYEFLREDNLPTPDRSLTDEETRYYIQELQLHRLNQSFSQFYSKNSEDVEHVDVIIAFYQDVKDDILSQKIEGPLTDLIGIHGHEEARRMFSKTHDGVSIDDTRKRRNSQEEVQKEKRVRTDDNTAQSATANKFMDLFDQSVSGGEGLATPSKPDPQSIKPSTSSASTPTTMFGNVFTTPAPAPTTQQAKPFSFSFGAAPSPAPATTASEPAKGFTPTFGAEPASTAMPKFGGSGIAHNATFEPAKGFTPVFSVTPASPAIPQFGSGGAAPVGFMNQFATQAQAKAKKAAMDEDFDSDDDETREEWEARYEEERKQKEAKIKAAGAGVVFTPSSSAAGSTAGSFAGSTIGLEDETRPKDAPSALAPPAAKAGSIFSFSRSASPAAGALTPGGSIFGNLPRASTPSLDNPFAKFAAAPSVQDDETPSESSTREDDGEEDNNEDEGHDGASEAQDGVATPKANRPGPFLLDEDPESTTPKAKSLFDRVPTNPSQESPQDAATETPKQGNIFGRITRDPLATTQANHASSPTSTASATDQTWTPGNAIKFAESPARAEKPTAASPFKFSFTPTNKPADTSSNGVTSGLFSGLQTPAAGFGFSSAAPASPFSGLTPKPSASTSSLIAPSNGASALTTPAFSLSRATTPGVSDMSGAESAAESTATGDDAPKDAQVDLLSSTLNADKVGHEVLFENPKSKVSGYDKEDKAWKTMGLGPVMVLKHQETGVSTLLMRATPSGNIVLNTRLSSILKPNQEKKRVTFTLIDEKGPKSCNMAFASEDRAKDFANAMGVGGAK